MGYAIISMHKNAIWLAVCDLPQSNVLFILDIASPHTRLILNNSVAGLVIL